VHLPTTKWVDFTIWQQFNCCKKAANLCQQFRKKEACKQGTDVCLTSLDDEKASKKVMGEVYRTRMPLQAPFLSNFVQNLTLYICVLWESM